MNFPGLYFCTFEEICFRDLLMDLETKINFPKHKIKVSSISQKYSLNRYMYLD